MTITQSTNPRTALKAALNHYVSLRVLLTMFVFSSGWAGGMIRSSSEQTNAATFAMAIMAALGGVCFLCAWGASGEFGNWLPDLTRSWGQRAGAISGRTWLTMGLGILPALTTAILVATGKITL